MLFRSGSGGGVLRLRAGLWGALRAYTGLLTVSGAAGKAAGILPLQVYPRPAGSRML